MKITIRTLILALLFAVILYPAAPVYGQAEGKSKAKADSTWNQWNLRISPYFWLIGLKGQIAVAPEPGQLPHLLPPVEQMPSGHSIYDIDLSFKDIRNSLKFALMLAGQYKTGRFVTQMNVSSLVMETRANGPFDFLLQGNTLYFTYLGGDLGAGYRLLRSDILEFDALLGMKFVYFYTRLETEITGTVPISAKISKLWVDPVLATNFTFRPHRRIELVALGDIGPSVLNNKLTYQFSAHANFMISRHIHISGGYRNYYVKVPKEEAIFSGTLHGMIVKIGVQF